VPPRLTFRGPGKRTHLIRINAAAPVLGEPAKNRRLNVADRKIRSGTASSPGFTAGALPLGGDVCPSSESSFLAELGERVREMRAVCGLSRRELARQSDISERYVAQIEAGKGNVSIALLLRIAYAIRRAQDDAA
jgi:DNA-binding XRE family transcriptional regulator